MAVRETLVFELRGALAQLDTLERQIDDLRRPVVLDVDITGDAAREISTIDTRLDQIVDGTQHVNRELADMENAASRSVGEFNSLETSMDSAERSATGLSREMIQAEGAATRLSVEGRDVATDLNRAENAAASLTTELRQADRAAAGIDTRGKGLVSTFGSLNILAGGIGGALAAIGGTAILGGALRGANAAIQSFAQLEDSINAVNVVFGNAAQTVVDFGESAAASAGLSELAFNQAVVPIGSLLQNFGFDARAAADASVVLVQRAADLASVMGGTVQDALIAVGAALRGEADPLERYGASVSAARVEQFALAEGLAATKAEITPAITLQARYGLILSDTARVAGDFANTSGDLANAQRTAAAEAANFGADLGEVLAPAMETIVALLPAMLDGVQQLVPGFAAAADSAAGFFESLGEGGGFRTEFAAIGAGFDIVTAGAGFATEAGRLFAAGLSLDFAGVAAAARRGGTLIEQSLTKGIAVGLANALDKGTGAVEAFTDAIGETADLTSDFELFKNTYRDFAIAAGLSKEELAAATTGLIDNAVQAGLTAEEIGFLNQQYALLTDEIFPSIEAVREFNRVQRENADLPPVFADTTRFATFATDTETAAAAAERSLIDLAAAAATQAANTADAFDLFSEQPTKIAESFKQGVEDLRAAVQAQLDFDINVAILRALDLDALADDFERLGVGFAEQLTEAVNNIPLAIEADLFLQGFGVLGEDAFNALVDKFVSLNMSPADARRLALTIASPQVVAAATEAGVTVGVLAAIATGTSYTEELEDELGAMDADRFQTAIAPLIEAGLHADDAAATAAGLTVDTYDQAVIASFAGLDPSEIHDEIERLLAADAAATTAGGSAGDAFIVGMQESLAAREDALSETISNVLNGAIYADSPPKLFLDAGKDSGEAFWSGFEEAPPPTVPVPDQVSGLDAFTAWGAAAAEALSAAVNDLPDTIDPGRLVEGFTGIGREAFDALVAGLVAQGITPTEAAKIGDSLADAGKTAGKTAGTDTVTEYWETLLEVSQQSDLGPVGSALGGKVAEAFDAATEAETAAGTTVNAYVDEAERVAEGLDGSALQDRLGGLFSGVEFVIGADQFTFPTSFAGAADLLLNPTAIAGTGTGGGVNVVNNIYNPTVNDLGTSVAQANQSTAAVGTYLNRLANT